MSKESGEQAQSITESQSDLWTTLMCARSPALQCLEDCFSCGSILNNH